MYARPSVRDYGSLRDMTQMISINGAEDGMTKAVPTHHVPTPSNPLGI